MFRHLSFFVFLLFLAFFLLFSFFVFRVTKKDYLAYDKLVQSTRPEEAKLFTARQERSMVDKEISFSEKNSRLRFRLRSKESELVLKDDGQSTEMVENMDAVVCYLQEELYYLTKDGVEIVFDDDGILKDREGLSFDGSIDDLEPMQKLRYLEAQSGVYYYKENSFLASQVQMQRLVARGHELMDSLEGLEVTMKGVAQSVQFSLKGRSLNFKAEYLRAKFYSPKGLL